MAFATRGRSTGRFLEWKVRLFFVGAVVLLVGMVREIDLLVLLATALLAVAFLLRFFERPEPAEETDEEEDEVEEAEASSESR